MKKEKLREMVRKAVTEAAAEGKFQKYAKGTFASMVKLAGSGGNANTPPFTQKAAKPGKSGPITEHSNLLLEGFEQALEEGRVGEWISRNLDKLKPVIRVFKEKLASGVEPFVVAVKKWKAGEGLSEEEKLNFINALASAGLFLLPAGALLVLIKNLVVNRMGGIA